VTSEPHPPCEDCGGPSHGQTQDGAILCTDCARQRSHAKRVVWCSHRIGNCCIGKATQGFDTEPSCASCHRHLTRTPAKRKGGNRSAPPRLRRQILERDKHQCQLRYPGICVGAADVVDHIRNLASYGPMPSDARANATHPGNHPSNLQASCKPCNDHKAKHEAADGIRAHHQRRRQRLRLPETKHPGDV
jgi:5-methylcytosine-specific restriction enzyme A